MREDILKSLVEEYYEARPNLDVDNKPLCIFFFACSGSGKSTTRKLLVDKLQATYVCNDEVRELLAEHPEATEHGIELKNIIAATVENIFAKSPNKLVIFDNNIIRYYMHDDSYLNVATTNHRPVFIIGLDVSEELLTQRIKDRGVNVAELLSELPGQLKDYQKAKRDLKPNWLSGSDVDAQDLINSIRSFQAKPL